MLEQSDLKQIREVVKDVVDARIGDVLTTIDKTKGEILKTLDERIEDVLMGVNQGFSDVQEQIGHLNQRVDRLYTSIDGFIALHQKLDHELAALRSRVERQEEEIRLLKLKFAA